MYTLIYQIYLFYFLKIYFPFGTHFIKSFHLFYSIIFIHYFYIFFQAILTKLHPTSSTLSLPLLSVQLWLRVKGGCPRGAMVKAMVCGIVVSEFVLQSRYYVHSRANTLGKGIEPPYPPSYELNSPNTVLLGEWLWHEITYKGWYDIKNKETKPIRVKVTVRVRSMSQTDLLKIICIW